MFPLNSVVSRAQAISEFGAIVEEFYQGQFVVTDLTVLCFFDRSNTWADKPYGFNWKPAEIIPILPWSVHGPPHWLPAQPKDGYQLFFRSEGATDFTYLGPFQLSSHSSGKEKMASFELSNSMSKSAWINFGGYRDWKVSGTHNFFSSPTRPLELDEAFAPDGTGHLTLLFECFECHEIRLLTNPKRGLIEYRRTITFGEFATIFSAGELPVEADPEVFQVKGRQEPLCISADLTLPKHVAILAVRHFLEHRRFPDWIRKEPAGWSEVGIRQRVNTSLRYRFGHSHQAAELLIQRFFEFREQNLEDPQIAYFDWEFALNEGIDNLADVIQWVSGLQRAFDRHEIDQWRRVDYQS